MILFKLSIYKKLSIEEIIPFLSFQKIIALRWLPHIKIVLKLSYSKK